MDKLKNLRESIDRLETVHGFSPEKKAQYTSEEMGRRIKAFKAELIKEHGMDLLLKVAKKNGGKLSEEKVWEFAQSHPKELTSKQIKMFFNKDGSPKEMIESHLTDALEEPIWDEGKEDYVPQKKLKVKKEKERVLLSQEESEEMPLNKLRDYLIEQGAIGE